MILCRPALPLKPEINLHKTFYLLPCQFHLQELSLREVKQLILNPKSAPPEVDDLLMYTGEEDFEVAHLPQLYDEITYLR